MAKGHAAAPEPIFVPLFEISKLALPRPQLANFATHWGRLLNEAITVRSQTCWSEFFMFPKVILWAPMRGGRRISKTKPQATVVAQRLRDWDEGEKSPLWKAAVDRSRKRQYQEAKQREPENKEPSVVSAVRLGDVKKGLQKLVSAPIAPKTPETLECLKKLHPSGKPPRQCQSPSVSPRPTSRWTP